MSYYDCDQTDRAASLYFKRADRLGHTCHQPNRGESGMEDDGRTVVLRTGGRVLDRYRVRDDGTLRRLRPLTRVS